VAALVERFGENLDWKASTMLRVVQMSKDKQRDQMTEKLKFLLSNPLSEDKDPATVLELNRVRNKLRSLLANIVEKGLKGKAAPTAVVALHIWCEGQFSNLDEENLEIVMDKLVYIGREHFENPEIIQNCLYAIQKLITRNFEVSQSAQEFLSNCSKSNDEVIRQTATEVVLVKNNMKHSFKHPPRLIPQDWTLSFLDHLVSKSLAEGAQPYIPKSCRLEEIKRHQARASSPQLHLTPYNVLKFTDTPVQSRDVSICSQSVADWPAQVWTVEGRVGTPTKEEMKAGKKIEMEKQVDSCRMEMALSGDWE
jgi:hypothetical protein